MSGAVLTGAEGAAERWSFGGRTMSQGLLGAIALILGVVGLAIATSDKSVPMYLAAIAEIALGLSLIIVGVSLSGAYARLLARSETAAEAGGNLAGTTVDMFLGGAVIVLAVLAILRVASEVLIPVAVIVIGVGLMLNSVASIRLANIESSVAPQQSLARRVAEEMVFATSSVRAVAGVAVLVLGILGVMGAGAIAATAAATAVSGLAMDLALVAMIIAGAALLLNSTSLSGRIVGAMMR